MPVPNQKDLAGDLLGRETIDEIEKDNNRR